MKNRYGIGDKPFQPSRQKIHERSRTAVDVTAATRGPDVGFNVADWNSVILSVASTTQLAGWKAVVRVWRWKQRANVINSPSGRWYAREEVTISLDGDVSAAGGGAQEYPFPTLQSEKMYFQIVEVTGEPDPWGIVLGIYGYVPRVDPMGNPVYDTGAEGASGATSLDLDPVYETITEQDTGAGAFVPVTAYIDLDQYEHFSLQISIVDTGVGGTDSFDIDAHITNEDSDTPGTLAAPFWAPINTELLFTMADASLNNAAVDLLEVYYADEHISNRWLRVQIALTATLGDETFIRVYLKKWK